MPPSIGDDGDTAAQAIIDSQSRRSRWDLHGARRTLQHKRMTDARHRLDFIQIGTLNHGVEHWTLLIHGILHARDFDINAKLLGALPNPRFVGIDARFSD